MNNNGDYFDESSRAFVFHTLLFEPNRKMFIDRTIVKIKKHFQLNLLAF